MKPEDFPDHMKKVQAFHAHFESLTGNRCTLSYMRIAAWDQLIKRGYTAADVALVIQWIRSQIGKQGSGFSPSSLQFSRLIADADLFEDRLNLAKSSWKKAPPQGTRPADPVPPAGWKEWLAETYPQAAAPKKFTDLPADIQEECRAANTIPQ